MHHPVLRSADVHRHILVMASDPKTVGFVVDQISTAGLVAARPMFGEFGIYCDGKMVAMVCDDRLLVKPTAGGRAFAEGVGEAAPYPGAKLCLLIDADRWDDRDWLTQLIRISAAELPLPKTKVKRANI